VRRHLQIGARGKLARQKGALQRFGDILLAMVLLCISDRQARAASDFDGEP